MTTTKQTLILIALLVLGACSNNTTEQKTTTKTNSTTQVKKHIDGQKHPYITKLSLKLEETSVNKGSTIHPTLTATYSNNTTKEIKNNITWIIEPKDAIDKATLTAKKETDATLQATMANFLGETVASNMQKIEIYWEVNGHRLPPEPDPAVNNATLLGIDSNNNGARDDVERWIYNEYKDKHPIHIDIAMQAARGYRLVL
jgi:hypothetical protein